jgi:branched-chain amino acid transport system substrate-binding protein
MSEFSRRSFVKGGLASLVALSGLQYGGYAAANDQEPVKWGCLDTMSGNYGIFGKGNTASTQLAIKEINDAGGILGRRVELIIEDEEANTEIVTRKFKKLALQDKVSVVQGAASTSCTAQEMKLAEQYKILHINCEFDSMFILSAKNNYTFTISPLNEEIERARIKAMAQKFKDKPDEIKRWMIWYPDYSYGHDMKRVYEEELTKYVPGAELTAMGHPTSETDYSTYIVKILEANPQVFVSTDWAGDATNFIQQAIPYDFFSKIPHFILNGAAMSTIVTLKDKLPEMWYICEQCNPYLPHMAAWRQKFYDFHGIWPSEDCSPTYYDGVYAYKKAVEKAGTFDVEEVIKAMVGVDISGPSGKRIIRPDHFADIDFCAMTRLVPSKDYEFRVPGEVIKVPWAEIKYTDQELVDHGCEWCRPYV